MRKKNEYLVFIRSPHMVDDEDGCEVFHSLMTAAELFDRMDMSDCTDEEIVELYLVRDWSEKHRLLPAEFHGCWHDWSDPLKMTIEVEGIIAETGRGTDH